MLLAFAGCSTPAAGTVAPHQEPGLFVRNRSVEVVCEVRTAPSGTAPRIDRLEPAEVIAPGGSRFFPLDAGAHAVDLLDCNGDVVLRRADVRVGAEGVMLSFEER